MQSRGQRAISLTLPFATEVIIAQLNDIRMRPSWPYFQSLSVSVIIVFIIHEERSDADLPSSLNRSASCSRLEQYRATMIRAIHSSGTRCICEKNIIATTTTKVSSELVCRALHRPVSYHDEQRPRSQIEVSHSTIHGQTRLKDFGPRWHLSAVGNVFGISTCFESRQIYKLCPASLNRTQFGCIV